MTNSQTKISTFYYNKSGNFCLIVCHEALFNWKLFKLGSVSVKDIRKNVPILQVGGSSHILSTPPVVWVVLLHKMAFCQSFISTTVHFQRLMQSKHRFLFDCMTDRYHRFTNIRTSDIEDTVPDYKKRGRSKN